MENEAMLTRRSVVLILLICLQGCWQENPPSPAEFRAYGKNPVLIPGEPGSWDELSVSNPDILWFENKFYLYYKGSKEAGQMAIGLAISDDGRQFTKFQGNPILSHDHEGFDAFSVGPCRVVWDDSALVMYYNANELAGFSPGRSIGRAEAAHPSGPWIRSDLPVLTSGARGEWDDGFVIPCSVLLLEDGSYIMYYLGGREYFRLKDFFIGMASSKDGIQWIKFNDPETREHPFANSDPVFKNSSDKGWDSGIIWIADIMEQPGGYGMYYTGINTAGNSLSHGIGYATSKNGIQWVRYQGNPILTPRDDPFYTDKKETGGIDNPSLLFLDTICYLYYDYASNIEKIGMATARIQ